jgi:outer membrane protein assembly factor BamB
MQSRLSRTRPNLFAFLAFACAAFPPLAGLTRAQEPIVAQPTGDYQHARLLLAGAWQGKELPLLLGLRDGKGAAVWYCAPPRSDAHYLWIDQNTVKLNGGTLRVDVGGRMVKQWAPIAEVGDYTISLDAKVEGGVVSGTYAARFAGQAVQGKLSGRIVDEQQLREQNALPAGKDWPGYYGVNFAFRGPECGTVMIDELQNARPLWKAEESTPCMWGRGPDGRYQHRAAVVGCDGGASSPVVAGGLVYLYYFRPTGPFSQESSAKSQPPIEHQVCELAAKEKIASPIGRKAMLDWHRIYADDVVVAIDGATGKTVWKTVLPDRSGNYQTHKWRGYNPTPLAAGGTVYVQGYGNRLYALEAASGKLLWEYGGAATKTVGKGGPPGAVGPVTADGVLAMTAGWTTIGLDPKTGKELWKAPGGNLIVWRKDAVERLIACGGPKGVGVSCLDPKTGKTLWRADTTFTTSAGTTVHPVLEGDLLVGFDVKVTANVAASATVLCYRLTDEGLQQAWSVPAPVPMTDTYGLTIANGHVWIDGDKEVFCLKLDDGRKVASVGGVGGARTQVAFFADGRLFIQPEGRHGGQSFFMLNGDPKNFRRLGVETPADGKHPMPGQWHPPHPHDTAYANQPVIYPIVDGRLFVRGHDGLYCYDLRKPDQRATIHGSQTGERQQ